jgi:hypothetical protein
MGKLTKAQRAVLAKCDGEGHIARYTNPTVAALRERGLIEKMVRAAPVGNWWSITPAGRSALSAQGTEP